MCCTRWQTPEFASNSEGLTGKGNQEGLTGKGNQEGEPGRGNREGVTGKGVAPSLSRFMRQGGDFDLRSASTNLQAAIRTSVSPSDRFALTSLRVDRRHPVSSPHYIECPPQPARRNRGSAGHCLCTLRPLRTLDCPAGFCRHRSPRQVEHSLPFPLVWHR